LAHMGLELGADVPVCVLGKPARMAGIGERLTIRSLPSSLWMVLVHDGVPVSTRDVFKALKKVDHPMLPHDGHLASWSDLQELDYRNDLWAPALSVQPHLAKVRDDVRAQGAFYAQLSGSGGTCFGLFGAHEEEKAQRAANHLEEQGYWAVATEVKH